MPFKIRVESNLVKLIVDQGSIFRTENLVLGFNIPHSAGFRSGNWCNEFLGFGYSNEYSCIRLIPNYEFVHLYGVIFLSKIKSMAHIVNLFNQPILSSFLLKNLKKFILEFQLIYKYNRNI